MGRPVRRPRGRAVNGILVLDKPVGVGSNEALQRVKRLYRARKAGHTGSLDRLASGLLPICFGEATKLSAYLLNADKHYVAAFRLGVTTSTGDAEGEVVSRRSVPEFAASEIEDAVARFRGEIEQTPPMHSALKHKGKRLYQLAHEGIVVERQPRPITIRRFEVLHVEGERMEVEVLCSKGTYIRTLAEDLGAVLGCGASVASLRRVGAGPFTAGDMVELATIETLASEGPGGPRCVAATHGGGGLPVAERAVARGRRVLPSQGTAGPGAARSHRGLGANPLRTRGIHRRRRGAGRRANRTAPAFRLGIKKILLFQRVEYIIGIRPNLVR